MGKKILVMDDEEMVRQIVNGTLHHFGFEVMLTRNGEEAIAMYQKAKESGEPFNAVILDLTIPVGMGGKEAMMKLKEIDPDVKGIVSSGYSGGGMDENEYTKYGFCACVGKPFQLMQLKKVLDEVLS